jgi:hypothetical protein
VLRSIKACSSSLWKCAWSFHLRFGFLTSRPPLEWYCRVNSGKTYDCILATFFHHVFPYWTMFEVCWIVVLYGCVLWPNVHWAC